MMKEMISFDTWYATLREEASRPHPWTETPVNFANPLAAYSVITWQASDGTQLHARVIRPKNLESAPVILMFHDAFVPVRGWYHMTRFIAAGFGVFVLENRCVPYDITQGWQQGPDAMLLTQMESDAASAAGVAASMPWAGPIISWGEGFGGGLAIVAAAVSDSVTACAAANPMPADFPAIFGSNIISPFYNGITQYFRTKDAERKTEKELLAALALADIVPFAKRLTGSILLATSGMDTVSPANTQNTLWEAISCDKKRLCYPKHAHERINDFEDQLLIYLRSFIK